MLLRCHVKGVIIAIARLQIQIYSLIFANTCLNITLRGLKPLHYNGMVQSNIGKGG